MVPVKNSRKHVILRRSRLNAKKILKMHFPRRLRKITWLFLDFWRPQSHSEFNSTPFGRKTKRRTALIPKFNHQDTLLYIRKEHFENQPNDFADVQDCCLQSGPVSDPFRFPLWLQCSTESLFPWNRFYILMKFGQAAILSYFSARTHSESGPKGLWPLEIRETFVSDPGFRAASNLTLLSSRVSLDLNEFLEPSRESLSVRRRLCTLLARVVARVLRCDTTRSARPLRWTLSAFDSARTP